MKLSFNLFKDHGLFTVQKEKGDLRAVCSGWHRRTPTPGWGPEIHLLGLINRKLKMRGFHLCRSGVQFDGHMYGDNFMKYLRTPLTDRKKSDVPYPYIYIIDGKYAIRSSAEEYNKGEVVNFDVYGNVFPNFPQPDWAEKVSLLMGKQRGSNERKNGLSRNNRSRL